MRRCRSPSWPVISACDRRVEAERRGGRRECRGRSPSVIMIAPPTRSGGASASAPRSAANSFVPVGVRFLARGLDDAQIDVAERLEPRSSSSSRALSVWPGRSPMSWLAGAIDDDGDDILQRPAVLLHEIGIGEGRAAAARRRAPAATRRATRRQTSSDRDGERRDASAISAQGGSERREGDRPDAQRVSLSMMSLAWT